MVFTTAPCRSRELPEPGAVAESGGGLRTEGRLAELRDSPFRLRRLSPPHRRPSGGYITVLADAYLMRSHSSSSYVVYGRASGLTLCEVPTQTAEHALATPYEVTLLGSWSGTFRGRSDVWSIWYSRDVPWAATSDVQTRAHAQRLVDEFAAAAAQADREGRVHSPSPPPNIGFAAPPASRSARGASGGFGSGFADGFRAGLGRGGGRRAFGRRR